MDVSKVVNPVATEQSMAVRPVATPAAPQTVERVEAVRVDSARIQSARARAPERPDAAPSPAALREDFRESVQSANERLANSGRQLNVSVDKATDTVVVKVTDRESGEMIRQIPPEAALQITRNIDRLTGILVDRSV